MDRRNFLRTMIGGLATTAAVRTFPFRVFSFPGELALPKPWLNAGVPNSIALVPELSDEDKKLVALVFTTDELLFRFRWRLAMKPLRDSRGVLFP